MILHKCNPNYNMFCKYILALWVILVCLVFQGGMGAALLEKPQLVKEVGNFSIICY